MKKLEIIIREFALRGRKIITSRELEDVCKRYGFDFGKTKVSLMNKGYLITIFRGIYYLKDYNEKKTSVIKYSSEELLSEGMRLKGANWYFGLNTALKMLNLTHETFAVSYVLNDKFNRVRPLKIAGSKYLFLKVKPPLFSFGIRKLATPNKIKLRYSDAEKTLLDMAYLYRRSGKPEETIIRMINEYGENISKRKLLNCARHYPQTIQNIAKEALE